MSKRLSIPFVIALVVLPALTLAQAPGPATQRLVQIINRLINWMTIVLIAVAVAFIVYAAWLYLTSGGDPEKIKTANRVILYAVVAVAVALLAYVFIAVVRALVGPPAPPPAPPTSSFSAPRPFRAPQPIP